MISLVAEAVRVPSVIPPGSSLEPQLIENNNTNDNNAIRNALKELLIKRQ